LRDGRSFYKIDVKVNVKNGNVTIYFHTSEYLVYRNSKQIQ